MAGPGGIDAGLLPGGAAQAPPGAVFEISPAREALMDQIAARIAADRGAALVIDYGHVAPGLGDTLQALHEGAFDDVLAHPGEADLTAHVDFAALAQVAEKAGLETRVTTQGEFLLEIGLVERAGRLGANASEAERETIRGAVERLAGPERMGELFKALAATPRGAEVPLFP